MRCPKCEQGNIINVVFKKTKKNAHLCDFCEALWLENDKITADSAHKFQSFSNGLDREHALEEFDELDQDHSFAKYTTYK